MSSPAGTLAVSSLLERLLASRGWREGDELNAFLNPRLEDTHSPWQLLGMEHAVGRILEAIAAGEPIRILGDYDCDGTLATVILRQALASLGARVSYRLPQRLADGYGLQPAMIAEAVAEGVRLAITVDTGIREIAVLEQAREAGLGVIVTDHHLPGPELPPACAIVNPHQPGCPYPDKRLCGSGVAFKLVQALLERSGRVPAGAWPPALRSYLKLVALATIADAVPLLGENRVLTSVGLDGLATPSNPGLRALLELALPKREVQGNVSGTDVAFRIAPRINAAGRMGGAERVVELFFSDAAGALAHAQALDGLNRERQLICDRILTEIAPRLADATTTRGLLLVAAAGWHRGVLGIVANRLLQQTGRPSIVVAIEPAPDGTLYAHGSGRAPESCHLLAALQSCAELFNHPGGRFGGHAQAVGFALAADHLDVLQSRLATALGETIPAVQSDGLAVNLSELTLAFGRELHRLEPWGEGNPEPLFCAAGVVLAEPAKVLQEKHIKLVVEQAGARQTALFWNYFAAPAGAPLRPALADLARGARFDLWFRLEWSRHPRYGERVQLILRHLRGCAAIPRSAVGGATNGSGGAEPQGARGGSL